MAQRALSVEYRSLASLRFAPENPRLHSKKQIRQLARSIETFGFNVPVLIDRNAQVIAGHGRVLAAQLLGMTHAPTIMLEHLTKAQTRAFMIADNRLTDNSVWDDCLLAEQLKELSTLELDFSLDVTGFEMSEINLLIEDLAPATRRKSDPADLLPECRPKLQVTQLGDVWVLGRHRVYCGDGRNNCTYSSLMGGQRAHMVFMDLCRSGRISDYAKGFEKDVPQEPAETSARMSPSEFADFLRDVLTQLARNTIEGSLHFISIDWRRCGELFSAARSAYMEPKDVCVWVRDTAGQGPLYGSQHELFFIFESGKGPNLNVQLSQNGRCRTNVWHYTCLSPVSHKSNEQNSLTIHPAAKPVKIVADAILDGTSRADIVLDPFLGSGTTVIAAERTGRVCYGIELDPCFVDIIVRRWQVFTGQKALHESTGRSFGELEGERHGRTEYPAKKESAQVGYCKPPEHTRFKKGQSGNPKGRPKGALNIGTVLERALREKVIVNENGKRKTLTKVEAALKQLANKAASGELKAVQLLTALLRSAEERAERNVPDSALDEADEKVVLGILNRWGAARKEEQKDETHAG